MQLTFIKYVYGNCHKKATLFAQGNTFMLAVKTSYVATTIALQTHTHICMENDGWMGGCMDVWMYGCMMDGWMDG